MKAVVLTFDCLPIGFLGCYGNSLVETPHFDSLAARAVVFDQHFAENVGSSAARHAWMIGCYHFPRTTEQQSALPDPAAALRCEDQDRHGGEVERDIPRGEIFRPEHFQIFMDANEGDGRNEREIRPAAQPDQQEQTGNPHQADHQTIFHARAASGT